MERGCSKVSSLVLFFLIFSILALPAWGDNPLQKKVGKVAIVAQSGGDYTSPVTAMANVSNWCGTPSETNPCLVKVMPGVYDLAGGSLTMQSYVDIEGSGETVTIITSDYGISNILPPSGVVNGASNAEIRFLTVKNTVTSASIAVAIANFTQSPKITNVTATASGGTGSYGVCNVAPSAPTMSNVTATASGGTTSNGVFNFHAAPTMNNVTATASGGTSSNIGVYNAASSPTMSNITAIASGGTKSYGVYNSEDSSPTMNNVTATASGGTTSYGVYIGFQSSPAMSNVTATASGGTTTYGVYIGDLASPTMSNVTARGRSGSSTNIGILAHSGFPPILADRSTFEGSTYSVDTSNGGDLRIGGSKLIGAANKGVGTLTCATSYNESYIALDASCQ